MCANNKELVYPTPPPPPKKKVSLSVFTLILEGNVKEDNRLFANICFNFQERDLQDAQKSGNVDDLGKDIDKLQTEKRKVDNELRQLREEQQAMHMQSTTQAKLDMLSKEKNNKEDAIQKM